MRKFTICLKSLPFFFCALWAYIHGRALCDVERQTVPTHGQMRDDRLTFDCVWGLFDVRHTSHIIQYATVYVGPISRSRLMHTE